MLIDGMDNTSVWGFAYCTVTLGEKLTEGTAAFHIRPLLDFNYGRIWLTCYSPYGQAFPDLTNERYLILDIMQNQPKSWYFGIRDAAGVQYATHIQAQDGHLIVDLSLAKGIVNLSAIKEFSMGAEAPLTTAYFCILDNMRTEQTIPPPLVLDLFVSVAPQTANMMLNETLQIKATPIGGSPPYAIAWLDVDFKQIAVGDTLTINATATGNFEFFARVTDSQATIVDSVKVVIQVTEGLPPLPPTEPTPPNTSHIRVEGNLVLPFHRAVWDFNFSDTAGGWAVLNGEKWDGSNYARWSPEAVRLNLRNMRDVFKANCVRVFFTMDWYLSNSNDTIRPPTKADITLREALHALCNIAQEEGMDVELRMYDWSYLTGKLTDPLQNHTAAEFIEAWRQFALEFSIHPNVMFNLFDEATHSTWSDLAYRTIMRIREAGVGHVIYVHFGYCNGEIQIIRDFKNHYNVAFSKHEYFYHGTTEAIHQNNLALQAEGYPITITAGGIHDNSEIPTVKQWYIDELQRNIGITIFHWGRPETAFAIQQNTVYPCPPNEAGLMWLEILGEAPHTCPTGYHWDENFQSCVADVIPHTCPTGYHWDETSQSCVLDTPPVPHPCALAAATQGTVFMLYLPSVRRFRDRCLSKDIQNVYYLVSKYLAPKIKKLRGR